MTDENDDQTTRLMKLGYVAGNVNCIKSIRDAASSCEVNEDGSMCDQCRSALNVADFLTKNLESRLSEWDWPDLKTIMTDVDDRGPLQ